MSNFVTKQRVLDLIYVLGGALVLAISINSILLPNQIVAGGANGISIIINHLFGYKISTVLYLINIPLLVVCFTLLGKEVGMKTVVGSLVYPFFVGITAGVPVLTHNPLLAGIFGGVVTGLGLGLVFKGNASTGGTAIISQIVTKYVKIPIGVAVSVVDGFVILAALIAFDVEIVLYSLICLFVIGRVIDLVQVSFDRSKNVLIISNKSQEIQEMILADLDRGVTAIPVKGGYSHREQEMLMCVVPEKEFLKLRDRILGIDPHGFVVAMAASEVMGKGFSLGR